MIRKLTADDVRSEVERFWGAFTSKAADLIEDYYAHESTVFATTTTRAEPGRLAAARRRREYFNPGATVHIDTLFVDVIMLNETCAVASYTFRLRASKVASAAIQGGEEDIRNGRATQVFALDSDGRLRIMHEHFSVPAAS